MTSALRQQEFAARGRLDTYDVLQGKFAILLSPSDTLSADGCVSNRLLAIVRGQFRVAIGYDDC